MKIFNKVLLIFKWFFNSKITLEKPIKEFSYCNEKENSLGNWYEKKIIVDKCFEIKSPIKGVIGRIYPNNSLSLLTSLGVELIVMLKLNEEEDNFEIEWKKGENEEVDTKSTIFTIKTKNNNIIKVIISVIIPWQPLTIRKVEKGIISYKSPFKHLEIKNVYEY